MRGDVDLATSGIAMFVARSKSMLLGNGVKLLRFVGVGVLSGALYAAATYFFIRVLGTTAVVASALAFAFVIPANLLLQRNFAFRSTGSFYSDAAKYLIAQAANMAASVLVMAGAVDWLGLSYWWGVIAAIAIVPPITYVVFDKWVFRAKRA